MRRRSLLLVTLLLLTAWAVVPGAMAGNHQEDDAPANQDPNDDPNPNKGRSPDTPPGQAKKDDDGSASGSANGSQGGGPPHQADDTGDGSGAGADADEGDGGEAGAPGSSGDATGDERRAEATETRAERDRERVQERLPPQARDRVTGFDRAGESRFFDGRFVDVRFDAANATVTDVHAGELLVIQRIETPALPDEEIKVRMTGSGTLDVRGDDWRLRIGDAPTVPIQFHARAAEDDASSGADAEAWVLNFPAGSQLREHERGVEVLYPASDGQARRGLVSGGSLPVGGSGLTALVRDEGRFVFFADPVNLGQVSARTRPHVEDAIERGQFGASLTVLKATDRLPEQAAEAAWPRQFTNAVLAEEVDYVGMHVDVAEGANGTRDAVDGTGEADAGAVDDAGLESLYTITVDAEFHEGKTIAVGFESGLVAAERLVFRYFNEDENRTVRAAIVQADSIQDVLDPLDDGAVAEYWVVEDIDGVQVLVSIPHFSVHKIELLSMVEEVLERPSLALGVIGAVVVLAMATAAMVRKPEE